MGEGGGTNVKNQKGIQWNRYNYNKTNYNEMKVQKRNKTDICIDF